MKSHLYIGEEVENKDRKFAANPSYYPCRVVLDNGTEIDALFTYSQINVAIKRANKNREDIPKQTWIEKILN